VRCSCTLVLSVQSHVPSAMAAFTVAHVAQELCKAMYQCLSGAVLASMYQAPIAYHNILTSYLLPARLIIVIVNKMFTGNCRKHRRFTFSVIFLLVYCKNIDEVFGAQVTDCAESDLFIFKKNLKVTFLPSSWSNTLGNLFLIVYC